MARPGAIVAAMKALPAGGRYSPANAAGMGRISPAMANAMMGGSYNAAYGPFLPRNPEVFTDGAFAPAAPIQPTPINNPPQGGTYPGPRYWEPRPSWNLPTPPGTEGLKLASFDQLRTLAQKYSVARAAIELRIEEIRGLDWNIALTTDAAKAYQKDNAAMKDFGERKKQFVRFFRRPDPDFWNFDSFLAALLEEIFVFDALSIIFRPKYGARLGMGGKGLLGSDLDSMRLVSGPTIRPLIDVWGGKPAPPDPAYQQYLYGVPRSDYMTIAMGTDIEESGLEGAQVNEFNADIMLYAPYWPVRESPYGFPPVERALLPIISGLQKQEFQLDYFTEGTVPAVYISPGDNNITPTQIGELQNALNSLAGDPAYHLKVIVLPPGSHVDPQRPVDLSDSFDYLVMNQVCMAFDVQPIELGIIPNVGGTPQGPSASGIRFMGQEARDIKSRKSTKPLLSFIQDIFNHVIQVICDQPDMQFQFEGMIDDEDKQAITALGVDQLQNGISSVDEVRERLDLPPWGMRETSEPIVMTQQGPVPFSMAPQLIQASMQQMMNSGQQSSSSSSKGKSKGGKKSKTSGTTSKPKTRSSGGTTKPNGSHPAPNKPSNRPSATPAHQAASAAVQRPQRGKTGGTANRSPVAGSRKRGAGVTPTQGRMRNKAAVSELENLKRFLRKDRDIIWTWQPKNIETIALARIAEDLDAGYLVDVAVDREIGKLLIGDDIFEETTQVAPNPSAPSLSDDLSKHASGQEFPGWEHDLGLVGRYRQEISQAFQDAEINGRQIRKEQAAGGYTTISVLNGMIADSIKAAFTGTISSLYQKAWDLGYEGGAALVSGKAADFSAQHNDYNRQAWVDKETQHWVDSIARTGLGNSNSRSEMIARTEVARAMNAGVMQAYKDRGITHKHLLLAPDDRTCPVCKSAASAGVIPLDAIFTGGEAPFHPQCRCVPAPAGVNIEPPQAHISKAEDKSRLAWLLLRSEDEDGKQRFLLQQRSDGSWGMPGGTTHKGEDPWDAAVRETTEEIGDLPNLKQVRTFHHVEDDDETQVYLWLCDVPYFQPKFNGSTPEETQGAAWFRRKEIGKLDLAPKFREDWEKGICLKDNATKSLQNIRTENGEWLTTTENNSAAGGGSRWPYPSWAASSGYPSNNPGGNSRPGGGQNSGEMGATEPPVYWPNGDDMSEDETARIYPRGSDDGRKLPAKKPGKGTPARHLPDGDPDGMYPEGGIVGSPGVGAQSVPGGNKFHGITEKPPAVGRTPSRAHPVVGMRPPHTPHPSQARPVDPNVFDPEEAVEHLGEKPGEGNVVFPLPHPGAPGQKGAGGPSDYSDANPVDAEHVYVQMAKNFPPEAIQWVKRAKWTGPHNVPWGRVDTDDIENWAASHQPEKVKEFEAQIKAHQGHVAPSVLVQNAQHNKAFIVDGHHRALARKNLGQDVLAYLGHIDEKDREAAEETHTKQIHSGSSPQNKGRTMVSKESVHYREGTPARHCGNCVMFHPGSNSCDLVKGMIKSEDTCDDWEAK